MHRARRRQYVLGAELLVTAHACPLPGSSAPQSPPGTSCSIRVLFNRVDLITGGNAYVPILPPEVRTRAAWPWTWTAATAPLLDACYDAEILSQARSGREHT